MSKRFKPQLMAIINVTPDSYYSSSRTPSTEDAIKRAIQAIEDGADILDIGGESTRPRGPYGEGAVDISIEDEIDRVVPVIKALSSFAKVPISIDTFKPEVAEKALDAGATIINDVNGCRDERMIDLVAQTGSPVCVMHMLGDPKTMQSNPTYKGGVTEAILNFFEERIDTLTSGGVSEKQIILDPGIGFGKTVAHNIEIIHNLPRMKALGFPLLLGASRKTFMREILNKTTEELLSATLAVSTYALDRGANILRVHDVPEHRDVIDLFWGLKNEIYEKESCMVTESFIQV